MSNVFTLSGEVDVDISKAIADVKGLGNEADKTSSKFAKMGEKLSKVGQNLSNFGATMTKSVSLPILGVGAASFKLASDMEENINKVNVVFGKNADSIKEWSNTTLKQFGISNLKALELAGGYGNLAVSMGFTSDQAVGFGKNLTGLAADMASLNNTSLDEAANALNAIFTGEAEPMKKFGAIMTENNLQLFASEKGIKKKVSAMTDAEKIQLRYNFVMEKTKTAHGDFANSSGSASNQAKTFGQALQQLGATIGEKLLPIITPVITTTNEWILKFANLDSGVQKAIIAVGGIAAAIGPVIYVGGKLQWVIGEIITKLGAFTTATGLATAPILAIVAAIGLLVGGFVELWNTNEEFKYGIINGLEAIKNAILPCFDVVKANADKIFGALKILWEVFVNVLNELWYAVLEPVWNGFVHAIQGLSDIFQAVFPILVFLFEAFAVGCQVIFDTVLKPVFEWIGGLVDDVMKVFTGLVDFIVGVFTGDWEKAWEGVVNIFDGIFSTIWEVAKLPLNGIIKLINKVIGGLNSLSVDFPSWVPFVGGESFSLNIPEIGYLENGGILTQPTMLNPSFMAGEKNRGQESQAEAVIPLDVLWEKIDALAQRPIVLTAGDGRELMRFLAPYQKELHNYNNLRFV